MSTPFVDVVIACHDPRRPIERAVSSVVQDAAAREHVRVSVVAHGIDPAPLRERLAGITGTVRVLGFDDGIRSAAGPFNYGLAQAEGEYCAVMGSDDFLEAGAMAAWIAYVQQHRPDAAIAPVRLQGEALMPNPLVRLGRSRRLDAARDRLFYRTAPLGLIRTARMRELGLRMREGVRVGEDFEFGIRLWSQGGRVDLLRGQGAYVIGQDAAERTTLGAMTMTERLAPIAALVTDGVFDALAPAHRRALVIKLIRVTVVGNAQALAEELSDADVTELSALLDQLGAQAPTALRPFNRQDRRVLDGLRAEPTAARLRAEVARGRGAGRALRWLTPNLVHSFARESTLRRYVLYYLTRERKTRP